MVEVNNPQFVEEFRELYRESIKPLLEEGSYGTAHGLLGSPVQYLNYARGAALEILRVHCGLSLAGQIIRLYNETKGGKTPDERTIRNLEAFMAQTQLPFIPNTPSTTEPIDMNALLDNFVD